MVREERGDGTREGGKKVMEYVGSKRPSVGRRNNGVGVDLSTVKGACESLGQGRATDRQRQRQRQRERGRDGVRDLEAKHVSPFA